MKTKISVYKVAVRSVLFYAVESWPLKALHLHDLEVFDHHCLRKILKIRYSDRISNVDVRHHCCKIEPAATIVKQRRLRWLGHVLRRPNDRIIKTSTSSCPVARLAQATWRSIKELVGNCQKRPQPRWRISKIWQKVGELLAPVC